MLAGVDGPVERGENRGAVASDGEVFDAENGRHGSKSGRRSRVRAMACSRRHFAMLLWWPLSKISGTFQPRKSNGRV